MLASYLGLPRQSEILVIIFLGICFLSLDFSLFQLKDNLEQVWKINLVRLKILETGLKYVISAVVLVRTFSLHVFLAFYVIMLWPAIFEEKPNLMLPWLLLGIIRCLVINGVTLVVGTFICQQEKGLFSPICFEYILAQIIEHGPSVYAWMSVLSFYRELVKEQGSPQSSTISLSCDNGNNTLTVADSQYSVKESEDDLDKAKSFSLTALNLDYLHSNRTKSLPGENSIEILINEVREMFARKRIVRGESKSFDSIIKGNLSSNFKPFTASASSTYLTVLEKSMKTLDILPEDIQKAKQESGRFLEFLKEVSMDDVNRIFDTSTNSSKDNLRKAAKTHHILIKSHSQTDDAQSNETCLCYIRKQLQLEQSNQTLLEAEIANITFNSTIKDAGKFDKSNMLMDNKPDTSDIKKCTEQIQYNKGCNANKIYSKIVHLNESVKKNTDLYNLTMFRAVVVGGPGYGFNPDAFLKSVLKKNTSKHFGCQVTMLRRGFLEESRYQMAKKLMFLRHFGLS